MTLHDMCVLMMIVHNQIARCQLCSSKIWPGTLIVFSWIIEPSTVELAICLYQGHFSLLQSVQ